MERDLSPKTERALCGTRDSKVARSACSGAYTSANPLARTSTESHPLDLTI